MTNVLTGDRRQAAAETPSPSREGVRPGAVRCSRLSSPLIHVLLALLAEKPRVESTLLRTYGGKNLAHQLNAHCTTYTFCFISGRSRAANAHKSGNRLCSKNTNRRS